MLDAIDHQADLVAHVGASVGLREIAVKVVFSVVRLSGQHALPFAWGQLFRPLLIAMHIAHVRIMLLLRLRIMYTYMAA